MPHSAEKNGRKKGERPNICVCFFADVRERKKRSRCFGRYEFHSNGQSSANGEEEGGFPRKHQSELFCQPNPKIWNNLSQCEERTRIARLHTLRLVQFRFNEKGVPQKLVACIVGLPVNYKITAPLKLFLFNTRMTFSQFTELRNSSQDVFEKHKFFRFLLSARPTLLQFWIFEIRY